MNLLFRPKPFYPKYPPYHQGEYLEEYFFKRWNEDKIKKNREYIDIFWTNIYCNKDFTGITSPDIQKAIDTSLDNNKNYFTICQHDDGPLEKLPKNTIIFSAGGNRTEGNIVPIPLICSNIPNNLLLKKQEKNKLASFVGSNTHEIRKKLINTLQDKKDFLIKIKNWSINVSFDFFQYFTETTKSSKFSLAPRGYGKSSFRLYEIMQLGSVPVYVSDDHYLPWKDELNWEDFCVIVKESEIEHIEEILRSIKDDQYENMLEVGKKVYTKYFTMEGMYQNIVKRI